MRPRLLPQPAGDLEAVHPGQADVEQHDFGAERLGGLQRGRRRRGPSAPRGASARSSRARLSAASTLSSTTRMRRGRRAAGAACRLSSPLRRRNCACRSGSRTTNSLPRPQPVAVGLDRAAVHLDEVLHQRQADAQPALRPCGRRGPPGRTARRLRGSMSRGDADARVPDPEHRLAPLPLRGQPDPAAFGSVYLAALVSRFADDLGQPHRVGVERQPVRPAARRSARAADVDERAGRSRPPGRPRRQVRPAPVGASILPRDDPGHVQQVVDQPGESAAPAAPPFAGPLTVACLTTPPGGSTADALRIGASGLRSSWASIARNSSFRRSATASLLVPLAQLLAHSLSLVVQAGVVDGDRRLGRDPLNDSLVPFTEDSGLGVAEESAQDFPERDATGTARYFARAGGPRASRSRGRFCRSGGPGSRRPVAPRPDRGRSVQRWRCCGASGAL